MNSALRILFSKSLLLTYILIGYLAISDAQAPLCTAGTIPNFSTDPTTVVSPGSLRVLAATHLRPIPERLLKTSIAPFDLIVSSFSPDKNLLYSAPVRIAIGIEQGYQSFSGTRGPPRS